MVVVKIFSMEKNEDDILEDWIIYHAYFFGLSNLYIIDNFSDESTIKILTKYQLKGLHWSQQPDYRKKGDYLYQLIHENENKCDIAIPIDIDEFIAMVDINNITSEQKINFCSKCLSFDYKFYIQNYPQVKTVANNATQYLEHYISKGIVLNWDPCPNNKIKIVSLSECQQFIEDHKQLILKTHPELTISCDREKLIQCIDNLPHSGRYSFLYYITCRNTEIDFESPIQEIQFFDISDYEKSSDNNLNKKFFEPKKLLQLDHGNHYGKVKNLPINQSYDTQLVLFHYHHRGVRKMINKCINDIMGLGNVDNIHNISMLKENLKKKVNGYHNIETYLSFYEKGPHSLLMDTDGSFHLPQISELLRHIKIEYNSK